MSNCCRPFVENGLQHVSPLNCLSLFKEFFFFLTWTTCKVFIEFVTVMLLFFCFRFSTLRHVRPSLVARAWTLTPCVRRWSPNRWAAEEALPLLLCQRRVDSICTGPLSGFLRCSSDFFLSILLPIPLSGFLQPDKKLGNQTVWVLQLGAVECAGSPGTSDFLYKLFRIHFSTATKWFAGILIGIHWLDRVYLEEVIFYQ